MPSNRRWSIQAQLRCVPPVILLGHLVLATCALAVLLGALLAARHPALSLPGGERRLATHSTIIAGAAPRRSLSADPLPTFNVSAHPVGYGAIELSPTGPYTVGQVITAFADPANGWQFDHWSGVVSGAQNPFTFTVSANAELTATFVSRSEAGIFNVVTSVVGGGEVVMTPGGPFVGGQSTLLTALPHVGWKFERWSGDIGSNQNPVALLVNGDTEVIALFALVSPIPTLTLAVDTSGQGMVTVDPSGPYVTGQPITLTAVAASGWDFAGWG
nr:hypothetical protein [Caldilineaceae bacterium]